MDINEAITTIEYHMTVTAQGLSSSNEAWQTLKAVLTKQTNNNKNVEIPSSCNECRDSIEKNCVMRIDCPREQSTPQCNDANCDHNINGMCDGTDCMDGMS
jgi:hypothetical protein